MTPDWAGRPTAVPYAVFGDPQSLNLYGYVRNDPVSRADADGHCVEDGCVVELAFGVTALAMAGQAYFATNPSQRNFAASLSQSGSTIMHWFHKSDNKPAPLHRF